MRAASWIGLVCAWLGACGRVERRAGDVATGDDARDTPMTSAVGGLMAGESGKSSAGTPAAGGASPAAGGEPQVSGAAGVAESGAGASGAGASGAGAGAAGAGAGGEAGAPTRACAEDGGVLLEPSVRPDQMNLGNEHNGAMEDAHFQRLGQSFTVGRDGQLAAIQVSPDLSRGARSTDALKLSVFACTDVATCGAEPLGAVTTCAAEFRDEQRLLVPGQSSPGLFDLSPLALAVKSGEIYRFELSAEVAPLCVIPDRAVGLCARPYQQCQADSDCEPAGFAVGVSVGGGHYQRGKMFINGKPWSSNSEALNFITYVAANDGADGPDPDVTPTE